MIHIITYYADIDQVACLNIWGGPDPDIGGDGDPDGVYFREENQAEIVARRLNAHAKAIGIKRHYSVTTLPQYETLLPDEEDA